MNKKSVTVPGLLQMKMKVNWIGMACVRRVIAVFGWGPLFWTLFGKK